MSDFINTQIVRQIMEQWSNAVSPAKKISRTLAAINTQIKEAIGDGLESILIRWEKSFCDINYIKNLFVDEGFKVSVYEPGSMFLYENKNHQSNDYFMRIDVKNN